MFAGDPARKIAKLRERLRRLEAEVAQLDEQISFLEQVADDADVRRVVAETPQAEGEHHRAKQDVANHRAHRQQLQRDVEDARDEIDQLLDRFAGP